MVNMKIEFSTDIPQFDKILADQPNDKLIIEDFLRISHELSLEEIADEMEDVSLNIDLAESPNQQDREMIMTSQNAVREIASRYFQTTINRMLSPGSFYFFDGNIFNAIPQKSFYEPLTGSVFISRQETKEMSLLETYRQVWNTSSHSWITYDQESYPYCIGLSCSIPKEGNNYFSQINDALNSHATYIFYREFMAEIPYFQEKKNIVNQILSPNDYRILGPVFREIASRNLERTPAQIIQDFHYAKLNGDFFDIRSYCKNTYGPKGLKKLRKFTSK